MKFGFVGCGKMATALVRGATSTTAKTLADRGGRAAGPRVNGQTDNGTTRKSVWRN